MTRARFIRDWGPGGSPSTGLAFEVCLDALLAAERGRCVGVIEEMARAYSPGRTGGVLMEAADRVRGLG